MAKWQILYHVFFTNVKIPTYQRKVNNMPPQIKILIHWAPFICSVRTVMDSPIHSVILCPQVWFKVLGDISEIKKIQVPVDAKI